MLNEKTKLFFVPNDKHRIIFDQLMDSAANRFYKAPSWRDATGLYMVDEIIDEFGTNYTVRQVVYGHGKRYKRIDQFELNQLVLLPKEAILLHLMQL